MLSAGGINKYYNKILDNNLLVFLVFGLLIFSFKLAYVRLPFFWDEVVYSSGVLKVFDNGLNPFVYFDVYKPPLFFLSFALLYKIFGYSIVISHLGMLLISLAVMCFTFLLGKTIYTKEAGFFAALILFFYPSFYTQSVLFYCDMLVVLMTVATVYFYIKQRDVCYFIAATLAVLTKESVVLLIVTIAAYELIINCSKIVKGYICENNYPTGSDIARLFKRICFILSPIAFFLLWMLLNKLILHFYLLPRYSSFHGNDLLPSIKILTRVIRQIFFSNYSFLLLLFVTIAYSASIFIRRLREALVRKQILLFIFIFIFYIIFFAALKGNGFFLLTRYYLFLQPFFFIISAASIISLLKYRKAYIPVFVLITIIFMSCWYLKDTPMDTNLNYVRKINSAKTLVDYLDNKFPNMTIGAEWPIDTYLMESKFGYTTIQHKKIMPLRLIRDKGLALSNDTLVVLPAPNFSDEFKKRYRDNLQKKTNRFKIQLFISDYVILKPIAERK